MKSLTDVQMDALKEVANLHRSDLAEYIHRKTLETLQKRGLIERSWRISEAGRKVLTDAE